MNPNWLYCEQARQVAAAAKQNVDARIPWLASRNKTYGLGAMAAQANANLDALDAKPPTSRGLRTFRPAAGGVTVPRPAST